MGPDLDNIFIPKPLEKQCAKNKAIKKDIDEWIYGLESMEWFAANQRRCRLLNA